MEHTYHALGFTDIQLMTGSHICFFYNSQADRLNILSSFISEGLLKREKCVVIGSEEFEFDLAATLTTELSATQALKTGQLVFDRAPDVADDKNITEAKAYKYFYDLAQHSITDIWPIARITIDVNYLLQGVEDKTDWLRFESKINSDISNMPLIFMCQFDLRKVSGNFLMNVLRTHPFVVIDGVFFENKFLLEPTSFLDMLEQQKGPIN